MEKVFDLKLVSIFIVIADRDRNFYFENEAFKVNVVTFVFIVDRILLDIETRQWFMYEGLCPAGDVRLASRNWIPFLDGQMFHW